MNTKSGLAALISILTISAISLAISVTVSLQSIDSAKALAGGKVSQKTLKIAESCIEEALLQIKRDENYSSTSLNVGNGSCVITVVVNDAPLNTSFAITVEASLTEIGNTYTKSVKSNIERRGESVIQLDWQEI